ncbi:MAG: hypothetical protein LBN27_11645 [Prevotellaceae bacterium]|jgi:hypothetical protein|nr:hypothetical protein [Prevotellaceae bacterium]
MRKQIFTLLIICCFPFYGMAQTNEKISCEILLNSKMLKPFEEISFVSSMDITPDGFVLLSTDKQFYILGKGGMLPLSEKMQERINAFSITTDNVLMFACGKELCYLDSIGKRSKLFDLPDNEMRLQAGADVLYLYGKDKDKYVIYVLMQGAKYLTLLEYPAPITSVLELEGNVLFAAGNKIILVDINGRKTDNLLILPNENDSIISMTNDFVHHTLYFSTNHSVYRVKGKTVECISEDVGGILKYDGEGLLIFNNEEKYLVRLRNKILEK